MWKALVLSAAVAGSTSCGGPGYTDRYDHLFIAASRRYWSAETRHDWCEMKTRAIVESSLREDATSPVGAAGLLQIMPATGRDYGVIRAELYSAKINVAVAAQHMEYLWGFWSTPRPYASRRDLERASYNAGQGNILRAQRACLMARDWKNIKVCLPAITGKHHVETYNYVDKHTEYKAKLQ